MQASDPPRPEISLKELDAAIAVLERDLEDLRVWRAELARSGQSLRRATGMA